MEENKMYSGTLDNWEKPKLERLKRNVDAFIECMQKKNFWIIKRRDLFQGNIKGDGKIWHSTFFTIEESKGGQPQLVFLVDDTHMVQWSSYNYNSIDLKESAENMYRWWGVNGYSDILNDFPKRIKIEKEDYTFEMIEEREKAFEYMTAKKEDVIEKIVVPKLDSNNKLIIENVKTPIEEKKKSKLKKKQQKHYEQLSLF